MNSAERTNIKALGIAHLLFAIVYLIGTYFLFRMVRGTEESDLRSMIGVCYVGVLGVALLSSGIGIILRKRWALPFMFIAGIGQLPAFPIGTLVGGWTLAVHSKLSNRSRKRRS